MKPWIRYAVALVIAIHGFVYLNAARGVLPIFEGWKGRSWLLGSAITGEALKRLASGLFVIAGLGIIATGIAIGVAASTQGVWRPLAIVASSASILSFFVFWGGRIDRLVAEGVIGMIVSLILLLSAIAFPNAFGVR